MRECNHNGCTSDECEIKPPAFSARERATEIIFKNSYGDANTITVQVHRQDLIDAIVAYGEECYQVGHNDGFNEGVCK